MRSPEGGPAPAAQVLVVAHQPTCGPGWLDEWLPSRGVELAVVRPYVGEAVPAPTSYAGLVVLGGAMDSWDDAAAPWLPAVRAALREAVDAAVPTLGICLGAQLLAAACGGAVEPGPNGPEVGALPVALRPAAQEDPLLSAALPAPPAVLHAVQWHNDTVVALPPGAVELAASAAYPHQAFRVGRCAWGVQWHPEATLPIVAAWARADRERLAAVGISVDEAVGAVVERQIELEEAWRPLGQRFADIVLGARATAGVPGDAAPGYAARDDAAPGDAAPDSALSPDVDGLVVTGPPRD